MPSPPVNPVLGFGLQPGGTSSFGVGTPVDLPLPGNGYQPAVDVCAVRQINPLTKDYVTDITQLGSPHTACTAMEQQVLMCLMQTVGGLPFAMTYGDRSNNLTKQTTLAQVRSYVDAALAPLVSTKQIVVLGIAIVQDGGRLYRQVTWRDLTYSAQSVGVERTTKAPA